MTNGCIRSTSQPILSLKEKRSEARIINSDLKPIREVRLDGCYNTDPQAKACDFVIEVPGRMNVYVELKGRDLEGAYKQVIASMEKYNCEFGGLPCVILIVCTRITKSAKVQKYLVQMKKKKLPILRAPVVGSRKVEFNV